MDILNLVKEQYDYMVSMRRHLHENPEVSNKEYNTVKFIMQQLDAAGVENEEIENGGVIGWINKGKPGPCILLRADCDALPTKECPNNLKGPKVCVSKVENAGHLCAHDAHTSMLIAEAKILNEIKDSINGSVVFLFERGEEGTGNIAYIFRYLQAHKKEFPITTCYGAHVKNNVPIGKVCVQDGPMLSGVGSFRTYIKGFGGHVPLHDIYRLRQDPDGDIHREEHAKYRSEAGPLRFVLSVYIKTSILSPTLTFFIFSIAYYMCTMI